MTLSPSRSNPKSVELGAVVIPFVIALLSVITILGMLTESALVIHARHKLFNGGETALLAAASLYPDYKTNSTTQAQLNTLVKNSYCTNNFLDASNTSLDFSQIASNTLILTSSKSVKVFFFQNYSLTVQCKLAASVPRPADGVGGVAPLAVQVFPYVQGTSYVIKDGGGAGSNGNYGALSLSGTGASDFENDLKYGYSGTISIGQSLTTKPGNMDGPTGDAVDYRLAHNGEVVIVVMTLDDPSGRDSITVYGFAAFQITGVDSHGAITGKFIDYRVSAATASATAPDSGVYTKAKLIYN